MEQLLRGITIFCVTCTRRPTTIYTVSGVWVSLGKKFITKIEKKN